MKDSAKHAQEQANVVETPPTHNISVKSLQQLSWTPVQPAPDRMFSYFGSAVFHDEATLLKH